MPSSATFVRDRSLTALSLLEQQEVGYRGSRRVLSVEREDTPGASVDSFYAAARSTAAMSVAERPFVVLMFAVGMVVDGRHGLYTLMRFPASGVMAAVHMCDSKFVAIMR